MYPAIFRQILSYFRFPPGKNEGRETTRRGRFRRDSVFQPLEHLEERQYLSATGFEALNQGVSGYDPVTGEWLTLRYDGQSYVQENAVDLNSVGRFSDPVAADLDGDGMDEIYLRDAKTGNWWSVNPGASSNQLRSVAYWATDSAITQVLVGDIDGDGRDDLVTMNAKAQWLALGYNGSSFKTTDLPA